MWGFLGIGQWCFLEWKDIINKLIKEQRKFHLYFFFMGFVGFWGWELMVAFWVLNGFWECEDIK